MNNRSAGGHHAAGAETDHKDRVVPELVTGLVEGRWPRGPRQRLAKPWSLSRPVGSNPTRSAIFDGSVNSVARVAPCLGASRGFDSRTGRQCFFYLQLKLTRWKRLSEKQEGMARHHGAAPNIFFASLAQWIRAPAYEVGGRTFESCMRLQTKGCEQSWLLQWTVNPPPQEAAGFESLATHHF